MYQPTGIAHPLCWILYPGSKGRLLLMLCRTQNQLIRAYLGKHFYVTAPYSDSVCVTSTLY